MHTYFPYLLLFLPGLLVAQFQGGSGDGSAFQRSAASSSLPLRLLSFTAARQQDATVLHWAVEEGTATDHFDVERSADGRRFTRVSHLAGDGREGGTYAATDPSPLTQGAYYRLRVVSIDQAVTFSNVVYLPGRAGDTDFSLFPNPARGTAASLRLAVPVPGEELLIAVYDGTGRQHFRTIRTGDADHRAAVSLPVLPPGNYLVRVVGSGGRQQSRWLTVSR